MSEDSLWKALRPLIKHLDPVRIESPIVPGIPDVNYSQGWIELKYAECWPVRGGRLRIDHFTTEQKNFLRRRHTAGGNAFLLLKVGLGSKAEWFLFDGIRASIWVGLAGREILLKTCCQHWVGKPPVKELEKWLLVKN